MPLKNNQKGIAHIVVAVIVFAVIVAIGSVGVMVFKANKKDTKTSEKSQTSTQETDSTKTVAKTSEYDKCLRLDDYKSINGGEPLDYYMGSTESTMVFEEVLYKPDSTEYADAAAAKASADKYASFYKTFKDRYWSIELQGEIKDIDKTGNSAGNVKLANDRANRFKNDLTSRGVAADKITISEPDISSADSNQISNARNVTVRVTSQCKSDEDL